MDLAKELAKISKSKPDMYFAGVVADLKELEAAGEAAIVGKKYIDTYNKLFDVYTSDVNISKEVAAAYHMKAKNAQIIYLAKSLYDEFKEHQTVQQLQDAMNMIIQGGQKINIKYHALDTSDISNVYKRVIADAPKWFVEECEYDKKPEYTSKGNKKPYKIPY